MPRPATSLPFRTSGPRIVDKGLSKVSSPDRVGENLDNRGVMNSVLIAEAIRTAQRLTGKPVVDAGDVRNGFENLDITDRPSEGVGARRASCRRSGSPATTIPAHTPVYIQQWDGTRWQKDDRLVPTDDRCRPTDARAGRRRLRHKKKKKKKKKKKTAKTSPGPERGRRPLLRLESAKCALMAPHARTQQHRGRLRPRRPGAERRHASASPRGAIVALLGANGAGKSTTLKAVSNLLQGRARGSHPWQRSCLTACRGAVAAARS